MSLRREFEALQQPTSPPGSRSSDVFNALQQFEQAGLAFYARRELLQRARLSHALLRETFVTVSDLQQAFHLTGCDALFDARKCRPLSGLSEGYAREALDTTEMLLLGLQQKVQHLKHQLEAQTAAASPARRRDRIKVHRYVQNTVLLGQTRASLSRCLRSLFEVACLAYERRAPDTQLEAKRLWTPRPVPTGTRWS